MGNISCSGCNRKHPTKKEILLRHETNTLISQNQVNNKTTTFIETDEVKIADNKQTIPIYHNNDQIKILQQVINELQNENTTLVEENKQLKKHNSQLIQTSKTYQTFIETNKTIGEYQIIYNGIQNDTFAIHQTNDQNESDISLNLNLIPDSITTAQSKSRSSSVLFAC
eukprot:319245_1